MKRAALILSSLLVSGIAFAASPTSRSVSKVGDGIYVIRHPDAADGFPQGNTTFVIGSRAVLVVDSTYLPSTAKEDIADLRKLTDKPVRYLLNTHWHPDHTRGNQTYVDAFPGLVVIAAPETAGLGADYDVHNVERYPSLAGRVKAELDKGVGPDDKPFSAADRAELQHNLAGMDSVGREVKSLKLHPADVTFDDRMRLDLGGRRAELVHARANTVGDAYVVVPESRAIIAGDIVNLPVPMFLSSNAVGTAEALEHFIQLAPALVVPGHGEVLHDTTLLAAQAELIRAVVGQVNAEVSRRGTLSSRLEDVQKAVDASRFRARLAHTPDEAERFDEAVVNLVALAFGQVPK